MLADDPWPLQLAVFGQHFQFKTTCIRFGESHRVKSGTYLSEMTDSGPFWTVVVKGFYEYDRRLRSKMALFKVPLRKYGAFQKSNFVPVLSTISGIQYTRIG